MKEPLVFPSDDIQRGSFRLYDIKIDEATDYMEFGEEGLILESDGLAGDLFGIAILDTLANPVMLLHPDDIKNINGE